MRYLKLPEIKKHLNLDEWFVSDDEYLISLGDTSEQMVDEHINNCLSDIVNDNDGELPSPLRHAMLLLIGNLYQNREGVAFASASEIPFSYKYLLFPYRDYSHNQS